MAQPRTYTATEARDKFADIFDAAIHEGPVFVTRRSKTVAIISADLLRVLTEVEAFMDNKKARDALREFLAEGGTPLEKIKEELGIT
jgi:prevent-host-death family protein